MNLVAGATGFLGREICRRLRVAKKPVRGLVRATSEPKVVDVLQGMGVELVEGDLRDRQSLDGACHGLSAVISTATTTRSDVKKELIAVEDGYRESEQSWWELLRNLCGETMAPPTTRLPALGEVVDNVRFVDGVREDEVAV